MFQKSAYLSIKQAAKILNVHENTVYRQIYFGKIPARKIGKLWRIPVDAVLPPKTEAPEAGRGNHERR